MYQNIGGYIYMLFIQIMHVMSHGKQSLQSLKEIYSI